MIGCKITSESGDYRLVGNGVEECHLEVWVSNRSLGELSRRGSCLTLVSSTMLLLYFRKSEDRNNQERVVCLGRCYLLALESKSS